MSWVKLNVHLVFSTKKRKPFLETKNIRLQVFEHILANAKLKNIHLIGVNGWHDHLHCLISLCKDQTISEVAQLIKGESSYWINRNKLIKDKFNWQDDYWAVSVSESHVRSVNNYIYGQEEHHRHKSFTEEIDEFMSKNGWSLVKAN